MQPRPDLNLLNKPKPIRVRVANGTPVAVLVRGSWRQVAQIRERWRIDDEWWRSAISRLYHQLVLDGGAQIVVFEDLLLPGTWYEQHARPLAPRQPVEVVHDERHALFLPAADTVEGAG